MGAATEIITSKTIENRLIKKRGRPSVLETKELVRAAMMKQNYRIAVNHSYAMTGLAYVALIIGEDEAWSRFIVNDKMKCQGALEQMGRFVRDGTLCYEGETEELAETVLGAIESGDKSRDIERRLREMRKLYKAARASLDGD